MWGGAQVLDRVERECCAQDWLDLRGATGLKRLQLRGVPAVAFPSALEVPYRTSLHTPSNADLLSAHLHFREQQEGVFCVSSAGSQTRSRLPLDGQSFDIF